jgi:dihydroorotate dehydrogenase (NAD+) catalytic subunit
MDLRVFIGKKSLKNPFCVASGTFGYGSEYEQLVDFSYIGAIFTKAITLKPRDGNNIPRIVETPSGLLNSIGLANVGVERFLSEKMAYLSQLPCAVIPNVAGSTEEEYYKVIEKLETNSLIWGYEINLSCPNVKCGGLAFGTKPELIEQVTRQIRTITDKPVIIKLTPNTTDITVLAKAAENGGADAVSCINTLIGMVIDVKRKKTVLPAGAGGLSGPAIRPVGVAMTYKVAHAVSIPVIGIGGITNAEDALQYFLAGACGIQIGTANFIDPDATKYVYDGVIKFCVEEGLMSIKDLHQFLL